MSVFKPAGLLLLTLFIWCSVSIAASKRENIPSAKEKCPVCGMFVAKYPDWTAIAKTADGKSYFYDGPKDMFIHYFNVGKYTPGRKQTDITGLSVKEYYSMKMIDAKKAFFVTGSTVYGPMGAELIPVSTEKDAETFLNDHKGKRIVRFSEITAKMIQELK